MHDITRRILATLLVAGWTLAGAAAPAVQPTGDEATVERLERELVKAIGARDLTTYDRLVADDYVVVRATGRESTKADVLASYRSGALAYVGLDITDVKAHVFGDTAIVSARTLGQRREGGNETPNRVRYIRVFARRGGEWRAVSQMATPAQEP
jgi:ketosteroid isomerase-like protein